MQTAEQKTGNTATILLGFLIEIILLSIFLYTYYY